MLNRLCLLSIFLIYYVLQNFIRIQKVCCLSVFYNWNRKEGRGAAEEDSLFLLYIIEQWATCNIRHRGSTVAKAEESISQSSHHCSMHAVARSVHGCAIYVSWNKLIRSFASKSYTCFYRSHYRQQFSPNMFVYRLHCLQINAIDPMISALFKLVLYCIVHTCWYCYRQCSCWKCDWLPIRVIAYGFINFLWIFWSNSIRFDMKIVFDSVMC